MTEINDEWSPSFRGQGDPQPEEHWLTDPRYVLFPKAQGRFPGKAGGTHRFDTGILRLPLNRFLCSKTPDNLYLAAVLLLFRGVIPPRDQLERCAKELERDYDVIEIRFPKKPVKCSDFRFHPEMVGGDKVLDTVFRQGLNKTKQWELIRRSMKNGKVPIVLVPTYVAPPEDAYRIVVNVDRVTRLLGKGSISVNTRYESSFPWQMFEPPEPDPIPKRDWSGLSKKAYAGFASVVFLAVGILALTDRIPH